MKTGYGIEFPLCDIESVRRVFGDDGMREMVEAKIRDVKRGGFYVDVGVGGASPSDATEGGDVVDFMQRELDEAGGGASFASYYRVARRYVGDDGVLHEFVHVDPTDFEFSYVDFGGLLGLSGTASVVYLNGLYGMYVKNARLRAHDIVQVDPFNDIWYVSRYNIFDAGNTLPLPDDGLPLGITPHHHGCLCSSWEDFVDVHRRMAAACDMKCAHSVVDLVRAAAEASSTCCAAKERLFRTAVRLGRLPPGGGTAQ